jgi:hypothetical protein
LWVREVGEKFIVDADTHISRYERDEELVAEGETGVAGVGVFFFRSRE